MSLWSWATFCMVSYCILSLWTISIKGCAGHLPTMVKTIENGFPNRKALFVKWGEWNGLNSLFLGEWHRLSRQSVVNVSRTEERKLARCRFVTNVFQTASQQQLFIGLYFLFSARFYKFAPSSCKKIDRTALMYACSSHTLRYWLLSVISMASRIVK